MTIGMGPPSDSEMTWVFRVVLAVIAFLLALDVKDAKKLVAMVPGLVEKVAAMKDNHDKLEERVAELERRRP